jgi:uncharacterized protein
MLGNIITEGLFENVLAEWPLAGDYHSDHGPEHWFRVERNGLYLASHDDEIDPEVISLFALFHDSQRENECKDTHHGRRGSKLAIRFFEEGQFKVSKGQYEKLIHACEYHTAARWDEDPTIQACYEADRLDLWRVGYIPDPNRLRSDAAKGAAVHPTVLDAFQVSYTKGLIRFSGCDVKVV